MKTIDELIAGASTIAILGHIRPDGDCVGSTLGIWNYLHKNYPEIEATVYLENFSDKFMFLSGADRILHEFPEETVELCLVVDVSDRKRLGAGETVFAAAKKRICIDHHISNDNFADENFVSPTSSAASELVAQMMRPEAMDLSVAECLYMGIVHDTGVFKHSNTTRTTMEIAGFLLDFGVSTGKIIDDTFYRKTLAQNRAMGLAVYNSVLSEDGESIYTAFSRKDMEGLGVGYKDLDGIVDQIRMTKGVELAVFMTELRDGVYKLSLRSNNRLDVNRVAGAFGGGGHVRASGCEIPGTPEKIMALVLAEVEKQKNTWTE